MRLISVISEIPFPANHGGRVDSWRRLQALHDLGHDNFVVTWSYEAADVIPENDIDRLREVTADVRIFSVDRSLGGLIRRLPFAFRWPSYMAARAITGRQANALIESCHRFGADAVVLDGLHGLPTALLVAKSLGLPVLYRAHNVEHQYLKGQLRLATTLRKKAGFWAALLGLRRIEAGVHKDSAVVLDISVDDIAFWESQGFSNSVWLPTLHDATVKQRPVSESVFDIGYVGNFITPNNLNGILWFLDEVWPRIKQIFPGATAVFGGLNPPEQLIRVCSQADGVLLKANVSDPMGILASARVLINPVWMSSGVNVKMIDMLAVGRPIVTTPAGVVGFPKASHSAFWVADTAVRFAELCCYAIQNGSDGLTGMENALAAHSQGAFMDCLEEVERRIGLGQK